MKTLKCIKYFSLTLTALIFTSCKGGSGGENLALMDTTMHKWQELKSLEAYPASAYTLKEDVEYLEIRTYSTQVSGIIGLTPRKTYFKNHVAVKLGKKPLDSFDPKVVEKFKASSPKLSEESNIRKYKFSLMSGSTSYTSNGFMIDKSKKIRQLNKVSDVIEKLGKIDTPAEVKLVLWLNDSSRDTTDEKHKDRYRKTFKGYSVISEYNNGTTNLGECGHFTYEISISKQGEITEKKLLRKKPSKYGCGSAD